MIIKSNSIPHLVQIRSLPGANGNLEVLDDQQLPFKILRTYWIWDVPDNTKRGGHAHHTSKQLLICQEGLIEAEVEDLQGKVYQFCLEASNFGLYLPPMCWGAFLFRRNARALCLASDYYDETDYIRDYREFEALKDARKSR